MERSVPEPNSGCWLWLGNVAKHGYGTLGRVGETWAHRVSYIAFVGPIPDGLEIDHKCRVRCCVNPGHLRAVTAKENMAGQPDPGRKPSSACQRGHEMVGWNAMITAGRNGLPRRRCRFCHNAGQNEREKQKRRERGLLGPGHVGSGPKPHPQLEAMRRRECT